MCGIVGIIEKVGNPSKVTQAIFTQMLYADALRGWDATGVFSVNHSGDVTIRKKAVDAGSFFEYLYENKNEFNLNVPVLIGHNRAATKGDKDKDDNAHPFQEKNITLVHNGTLLGHRNLADVDVDSHAITHALTEDSPQELIQKLTGAYALCWYNSTEHTINVLRNNERPLHILETQHTFIISSEELLARWILSRNGAKVLASFDVLPDVHYKFRKENDTIKLFQQELQKKKYPLVKDSGNLEKMKKNLLGLGIAENSIVTLKVTGISQGATKNSWFKHFAEIIGTTYKCTFWSEKNYQGQMVTATIGNIYEDDKDKVGIYCKDITPIQKRKNTSANGIYMSSNLREFIKDKNCAGCGKPLSLDAYEDSFVDVLEYNDMIYGYQVYCPSCINKVAG